MITNKMRKVLEDDLGYLAEEVDAMEPQIAGVVIERGLARPSNGMPLSWQRPQSAMRGGGVLARLARAVSSLCGRVGEIVRSGGARLIPLAVALFAASAGYQLIRTGNLTEGLQRIAGVVSDASVGAARGVRGVVGGGGASQVQ